MFALLNDTFILENAEHCARVREDACMFTLLLCSVEGTLPRQHLASPTKMSGKEAKSVV